MHAEFLCEFDFELISFLPCLVQLLCMVREFLFIILEDLWFINFKFLLCLCPLGFGGFWIEISNVINVKPIRVDIMRGAC